MNLTYKQPGTPSWANLARTPDTTAPAPNPYQPTVGGYGRQDLFRRFNGTGASNEAQGEWNPSLYLENLGGLMNREIDNLYNMAPVRESLTNRAINVLGPGGVNGLIDAFRQRAMGQAREYARQNAAALRANGITGQEGAAALDANNRAADATNSFAAQQSGYEGEMQRIMQALNITSPENMSGIAQLIRMLDPLQQQRSSTNNAEHAARAGSGLAGILGNALGGISGGGFGNPLSWFGFGRGGGGSGGRESTAQNFYTGDLGW